MFFDDLKTAPSVVPSLNIGGMLDIPTGEPVTGKMGETITNGGIPHVTGIVAEGNVGKTQLLLYMYVTILGRYMTANGLLYDTENHLKKGRQKLIALANQPHLVYTDEEFNEILKKDKAGSLDENDIKRSWFTRAVEYLGDELWDWFRPKLVNSNERQANLLTPFVNFAGKQVSIYDPIVFCIDSLSMWSVASGEKMQTETIGTSKRNMESMRSGMAKTQFLIDLQNIAPAHGVYSILTGHIGTQYQIDPFSPPSKVLASLQQGKKIKNVPEKFLFTPHNVWYMQGGGPLYNSSKDKTPQYPKHQGDTDTNSKELTTANIWSLRNKSGVSGNPFELLMSQSEGFLPALTEFHYCKSNNRFGLGGNMVNMCMVFYPDVKFSRTTIRTLLREDNKLRCAVRLTSEILQAKEYWTHLPTELFLTPEEIYSKIKELGYDWDELLQTRGHWLPDQYENEVKFLSGMDLLYMCSGQYKPYWLGDKK